MIGLITAEARAMQAALVKAKNDRDEADRQGLRDLMDEELRHRDHDEHVAIADLRKPDDDDEDEDYEDDSYHEKAIKPASAPSTEGGGPFSRALAHRGGRVVQGRHVTHVSLHDAWPQAFASLQTRSPASSGSSLHGDPGKADLQRLDHAAASANHPLPGRPSGDPSARGDFHTAPTGKVKPQRRAAGNAAPPMPGGQS